MILQALEYHDPQVLVSYNCTFSSLLLFFFFCKSPHLGVQSCSKFSYVKDIENMSEFLIIFFLFSFSVLCNFFVFVLNLLLTIYDNFIQ